MLIRILHTQTELRQAELTSILMFRTVHHCIVNDKFGYKYRKQSTDHLQFRPIPRNSLFSPHVFFNVCSCIFFRFFLFFFVLMNKAHFHHFRHQKGLLIFRPE